MIHTLSSILPIDLLKLGFALRHHAIVRYKTVLLLNPEASMSVTTMIVVFCDVALYSLVEVYRRFRAAREGYHLP